ncbi:hypothetical protein [Micropruina sp.]|uniref:hypothetical protein n=1 Tax=Micropruina sp. TaxID=2737536 RepID=UPI0039E39ADD
MARSLGLDRTGRDRPDVHIATAAVDPALAQGIDADVAAAGVEIALGGSAGANVPATGGGDIHVGRTEGDVAVTTGGGDVRLDSCLGSTEVSTGAGDVRAHVAGGRWQARTGAGDIIVTVPPAVPVWQDLSSPLGDVTSHIGGRGEPVEGHEHIEITARTGTGDISLS